MARPGIEFHCFVLVVVRRGSHFLLVQEIKNNQPWYLPAGRVEPGETFFHAALRETLEEAGIAIRLDGILRIQHTPGTSGTRLRVIFLGSPVSDSPLKQVADHHSLGARWVRATDLDVLTLRSPEVHTWISHVVQSGPIFPLELLGRE